MIGEFELDVNFGKHLVNTCKIDVLADQHLNTTYLIQ